MEVIFAPLALHFGKLVLDISPDDQEAEDEEIAAACGNIEKLLMKGD